ncbi:MAG: endolytic transglycosylase MltG [Gemmatimonadota bacterium]|nr:endolytic transglycosylase MltG [Gemmatimonadota bacterium]
MRMRRSLYVRALLSVVGIATLVSCRDVNPANVKVVIPRGANLRVAAESLAKAHVIRNATAFRLYGMLQRRDRSLRAGTYVISPRLSWGEVLDVLQGGKSVEQRITIPEGWSLEQIVPQLAHVLGAPLDSVRAAVRDTALLHSLDIPTETLEGYLFPDTYVFPDGTTPRAAVKLMVDRFRQVWQPEWDQQLQARAMSRNDIMALAAIVEKEAKLPEERPVIAAVYLNRVKAGMRLQADPTVQYAIGHHVSRVLYKDLEIDSPYNTYRNKGLPPGPIASPGRPSIVAALNPANVPYLYFVAHPDGHHEFTRDFAAHAMAVKRARQEWDSVAAVRHDTSRVVPANVLPGSVASPQAMPVRDPLKKR